MLSRAFVHICMEKARYKFLIIIIILLLLIIIKFLAHRSQISAGVHMQIIGEPNLSFGSVKGSKGLTDEFYGFIKSRKRSIFVIDSYLKDSAFTAFKRDAKY